MHQASGRVWLGFSLALVTAVLWGILPLALKWLLHSVHANSITWIRFCTAAVLVGAILALKKQLGFRLSRTGWLLLLMACAGLLLNYILYLNALSLLSAESAQMLIQLAPFLMLIGAVLLFKEQLLLWQKVGAVSLVLGLILFFNTRLAGLFSQFTGQTAGVLLVVLAAFAWAMYALAQKQLLVQMKSQQIMWLIYLSGAVAFLPAVEWTDFADLSAWHWAVVLFCCVNTVIAYGAFAEALQHWQAANVSAVLAITPLLTIAFAQGIAWVWPEFPVEPLNSLAWVGAVLVVSGSMLTALAPMFRWKS